MSIGVIASHASVSDPFDAVTGLVVRLEAGASQKLQTVGGVSASVDNDPVGVWTDLISGATAVQSTAGARPLLKTNVYNGQPTLRFDGGDDQLILPGSSAEQVPNVTVFVVAKATSGGGRMMVAKSHTTSGWSAPYHRWGWYDDGSYNTTWSGAGQSGGSWSSGDLKIIDCCNGDYYANGTKVIDRNDADLTYPSGTTPILISGNGVGSERWNGDICAVMIWNRSLTTVERNTVRAALASQYGISVASETAPSEPFKQQAITYNGTGPPVISEDMPIGAKMYLFSWEYTRLQGLDATAPTITGWTLVTKGNTGTGDGGGIRMSLFERTCQAGDAGANVSISYQGASGLWAYASVIGYNTLLSHDTATNHVPGATSTAVTTTVSNQKILYMIGAYRSNGGAGLSIVNPAGGVVTDVVAAGDVSDTHGAVKIAIETQAVAGTSTVRTWTEANGVPGSEMGVLSIPIRV